MFDFSHETDSSRSSNMVAACLAAASTLRMIRLSATPQHTHTHTLLSYSYSHTIVATRTHTVHSHSCITKSAHTPFIHTHTHTRINTTLTDLTPTTRCYIFTAPSSLHGCYSRHRGVCEMRQSAKKPPSLPSKLGVVVVCCCANVLRGSLPTPAHGEVQQ